MREKELTYSGKAIGDKVCLKILNKGKIRHVDGLYIPEDIEANNRLGLYEVVSVGQIAAEEYDVQPGDYVYADRLSVFYDTAPYCYMKYVNLIIKTDSVGKELIPFKNMALVKEIPMNPIQHIGGVFIPTKRETIPTGTVIALNCQSKQYDYIKLNDIIVMTSGADTCVINNEKYSIYKLDMIIATYNKEDEK